MVETLHNRKNYHPSLLNQSTHLPHSAFRHRDAGLIYVLTIVLAHFGDETQQSPNGQ